MVIFLLYGQRSVTAAWATRSPWSINPVETEKLLGLNIHQSLKRKEHIISNKRSMIKTITTRLNALKRLAVNASFKTKLMVANSCFMSIIIYMVSVWGGT